MSYPSFAGFDPIFYLHHCQVDRVLSMWSIIHPDVWVPDEDINENLTPFWNAATSFWVSADVKTSTPLNYSYPEVTSDVSASQQAIVDWLAQISQSIRQRSPSLQGFSALATSGLSAGLASTPQAALSVAREAPRTADNTIPNWSARIRCNQHEFGTGFSVYLFLVEVPEDPAQWLTSPHFVGSFDAFINTDADKCANCRNQADRDIEGFVHINAGILEHSGQGSLEADQVVPFLTKNLHWRVLKRDGSLAELKSLEVTVVVTPLSLPTGAGVPTAGVPRHHHEVTRGRSGGLRGEA
jgi:tyrosinase